jgi:transposase
MEEVAKYEEYTKEELIQIILQLQQLVREQGQTIEALKKAQEPSKPEVSKDSTNSSIPTSKELIPRTRSQREKSGKKSGGQVGHKGYHRERNPNPDRVVQIEAKECKKCGASLEGIEGRIGQIAQEVDIPLIKPLTTEYQQVIKTCACGECNSVPLPIEGYVNIGPQMGALITYFNVEHALPYERLSQISHDLLGFAISEGTIENKLIQMQKQTSGLVERIKEAVIGAKWIGSDETGTKVGGKRYWNWVWQSPWCSYFVIVPSRGYGVVKAHFTQSYPGVLGHDCWSAQNNTPAGAHQLCHAHLLRNLQYAIDAERSVWAYRVQQLLRKSQRARDAIWQPSFSLQRRAAVIGSYKLALEKLLSQSLSGKEERRLQKRLIKHQLWIFTFLSYPDVPPDNNSSERAIKAAKLKEKVSGGFRSVPGATRFAQLLSVTQTLRKQKLPMLPSLTALFQGRPDRVPFQFSSA